MIVAENDGVHIIIGVAQEFIERLQFERLSLQNGDEAFQLLPYIVVVRPHHLHTAPVVPVLLEGREEHILLDLIHLHELLHLPEPFEQLPDEGFAGRIAVDLRVLRPQDGQLFFQFGIVTVQQIEERVFFRLQRRILPDPDLEQVEHLVDTHLQLLQRDLLLKEPVDGRDDIIRHKTLKQETVLLHQLPAFGPGDKPLREVNERCHPLFFMVCKF